jgi:hypothetical protein
VQVKSAAREEAWGRAPPSRWRPVTGAGTSAAVRRLRRSCRCRRACGESVPRRGSHMAEGELPRDRLVRAGRQHGRPQGWGHHADDGQQWAEVRARRGEEAVWSRQASRRRWSGAARTTPILGGGSRASAGGRVVSCAEALASADTSPVKGQRQSKDGDPGSAGREAVQPTSATGLARCSNQPICPSASAVPRNGPVVGHAADAPGDTNKRPGNSASIHCHYRKASRPLRRNDH